MLHSKFLFTKMSLLASAKEDKTIGFFQLDSEMSQDRATGVELGFSQHNITK